MARTLGHVALAAVSAALVVACAAAPATPGVPATPDVPASATPDAAAVRLLGDQALAPCVVRGETPVVAEVPGLCGTLRVPEDRANPGGRDLALRVAVIPATNPDPAPDPLFAIAGGPGEASTAFFAWLPGVYADIHATRDIVLVDQRGTGASNALVLPTPPDTSRLPAPEAETVLAAWVGEQLAALDADPRFYTSTVAADDLDDVRAALGYERINLYGASYGGTLAQYYVRQHADHVRVVVLDGSTPLDVPVMERMAANSQQALDLLLARCASDPACGAAFPGIANEWSSLVEGLEEGITTPVVDPETGEHAVADLMTVGPSLHNALRTTAGSANVPLAIHLVAGGNWSRSSELVPPVSSGGETTLMADEILCSEAWARFDPDEVARAGEGSYATAMFVARAEAMASLCRALPAGLVPVDDAAPMRTSLPVLWVTGDGDPQDPPANLSGIAAQQPNSRVVVVAAQEHVVGHLGCAPAVIAAFVDAGTSDDLDTSCLVDGPPLTPVFRLP
jgi:pimeloyl-ACP methyl ester carboxylesterase